MNGSAKKFGGGHAYIAAPLFSRRKLAKYAAIGKVTVRNQFAYIADAIFRSLFMLVILYILLQLWKVTYGGVGTERIAGYTLEQMIWYLIVSESIIMASPRVTAAVEEEVKTGGIAYLMTRPFHYVGYQYAVYMGEAAVKLLINLTLGGMLGLVLLGPPDFGWGALAFWPVAVLAFTVNFMIRMSLALTAFWVEETQGLTLVYDKLLFTIGGMLLPLELFPEGLRRVCEWLPFQAIVYFPVKTAVRFDVGALLPMIAVQLAWGAALALLLAFIYGKGARRLNVNGG